MLRAWLGSLLSERNFPFAYPYRYVACCHKGVFPEGLSRTVSRPNRGSCASTGLAAISEQAEVSLPPVAVQSARPHRKLRPVEFSSSTNGPRNAPDPTVVSGRNNPFPVTGAGE